MAGIKHRISLFVCLLLAFNVTAQKRIQSLDDLLASRSTYNAGFERVYVMDSSRSYLLRYDGINTDTGALPVRPMVINIWFPCKQQAGPKLPYSQYLQFNSPDSLWTVFLNRLKQFNETTIKENAFRGTKLKDTIAENELLKRLSGFKTRASVTGSYASGKFPLIIYQPSLGGTIEENALLLEYLAANGFIVISCAYQAGNGKFMGPDWDLDRSEKDVAFLLKFAASRLQHADCSNTHLLGYSFGAQSNFNLLTKPNNFVSAVSLDSRLEYSFSYTPRGYKDLPERLLGNVDKIRQPLLLFASEEAVFKIPDSMAYADRYYIPFHFLEHHDYAANREISNAWVLKNLDADSALSGKVEEYLAVCKSTLAFFKFYAVKANQGKAFPLARNMQMKFAEHIPRLNQDITRQSRAFDNPRQVLLSIEQSGVTRAAKDSYNKNAMLFSENLFNDYAYYLVARRKNLRAIDVLVWGTELYPSSSNLFDSLGEIYFLEKEYKKSLTSFQTSLQLNPANDNAVKYIKDLKSLAQ